MKKTTFIFLLFLLLTGCSTPAGRGSRLLCMIIVLLFAGCKAQPKGQLRSGANITSPMDVGTPGTIEEGQTVTSMVVPAGSTVTAQAALQETPTSPAKPAVVSVVLASPAELRSESKVEKASTGTIDTTVAVKRIEVEAASKERTWLMWTAIGCGVSGIMALALVKGWPSIGRGLLGASALAFGAWKLSEIPAWLWLAVIALVVVMVAFYKRAEMDQKENKAGQNIS